MLLTPLFVPRFTLPLKSRATLKAIGVMTLLTVWIAPRAHAGELVGEASIERGMVLGDPWEQRVTYGAGVLLLWAESGIGIRGGLTTLSSTDAAVRGLSLDAVGRIGKDSSPIYAKAFVGTFVEPRNAGWSLQGNVGLEAGITARRGPFAFELGAIVQMMIPMDGGDHFASAGLRLSVRFGAPPPAPL